MPLEGGTYIPQRPEHVFGKETPFRQSRINDRGPVALGEDEAVAVLPLRVLGIDGHQLKVKVGDDFNGGERRAGMTGLGDRRHLDDLHPDAASPFLESRKVELE